MTITYRRFGALLVALTLGSLACSDQVLQPLFGNGCNVGSLTAGSDVMGEFDRESCVLAYHFWSGNSVNYVSYDVSLTEGKGYYFYAVRTPDAEGGTSGSRILTLYGKDVNGQSRPLAVTSQDAGGPLDDSEFFFIAPRSGNFNLVVANYRSSDLGGYRVTMDECPVLGIIEDAGSYDFQMPGSACIRRSVAFNGTASRIALVGIEVVPSMNHTALLTSDAFTPAFELGGPDFDTYAYLFEDSRWQGNVGSGRSASVLMESETSGVLTLAVGATTLDPTGAFNVNLTRTDVVLMSPSSSRAQATETKPRRNLGLKGPALR